METSDTESEDMSDGGRKDPSLIYANISFNSEMLGHDKERLCTCLLTHFKISEMRSADLLHSSCFSIY